jgi:hypothetical protein
MSIGELEKELDRQSDVPIDRDDLLKALALLADDGMLAVGRGRRAITLL